MTLNASLSASLNYESINSSMLRVQAPKSSIFNDVIEKIIHHKGQIETQNLNKGMIEASWKSKLKSNHCIRINLEAISEADYVIGFEGFYAERFDVSGKAEQFASQKITELFFSAPSSKTTQAPRPANMPYCPTYVAESKAKEKLDTQALQQKIAYSAIGLGALSALIMLML